MHFLMENKNISSIGLILDRAREPMARLVIWEEYLVIT